MRLFFAVDLSDAIIERLESARDALSDVLDDGLRVRWTPPENMHVTLKFLGETDEAELDAICERAADISAGLAPFELTVGRLGAFPQPDHPRIIWAGVDDEAAAHLGRLHDQLDASMATLGFDPESRSYTPHVTLGRIKEGRAPQLSQIKDELDDPLPGDPPAQAIVDALVLYESTTTPSGAVYEVCERFALGKT